jgi:hypothetical protein
MNLQPFVYLRHPWKVLDMIIEFTQNLAKARIDPNWDGSLEFVVGA